MDSIKLHKNTEKLKSIIYGSSDRSVNIGGDLIVKFHRANLSHRCFLCYLLCLDISENNLGVLIEVKFKEFIINHSISRKIIIQVISSITVSFSFHL